MASILAIDDVPTVLASIGIVLRGSGHTVTGARNGVRGPELLKPTTFDLVITDIWMPGSSGTDLIREGRKRSSKTRFLAITGGDPNVTAEPGSLRQQNFGVDAVLLKPFEKAELLSAVSMVLEAPV
jgi:CheY-like chemotaxis protein